VLMKHGGLRSAVMPTIKLERRVVDNGEADTGDRIRTYSRRRNK